MREIRTEDKVDEAVLPECDEVYFARPVDQVIIRNYDVVGEGDDCRLVPTAVAVYREDQKTEGEN